MFIASIAAVQYAKAFQESMPATPQTLPPAFFVRSLRLRTPGVAPPDTHLSISTACYSGRVFVSHALAAWPWWRGDIWACLVSSSKGSHSFPRSPHILPSPTHLSYPSEPQWNSVMAGLEEVAVER